MYMHFSWLWVVSLLSAYVYILRSWVCGVWCSAMRGRTCSQGSWFFGGLVHRVMRTEDIIQPREALYFQNTVFFFNFCSVMSIQCRYSYCCIVPPPPRPEPRTRTRTQTRCCGCQYKWGKHKARLGGAITSSKDRGRAEIQRVLIKTTRF